MLTHDHLKISLLLATLPFSFHNQTSTTMTTTSPFLYGPQTSPNWVHPSLPKTSGHLTLNSMTAPQSSSSATPTSFMSHSEMWIPHRILCWFTPTIFYWTLSICSLFSFSFYSPDPDTSFDLSSNINELLQFVRHQDEDNSIKKAWFLPSKCECPFVQHLQIINYVPESVETAENSAPSQGSWLAGKTNTQVISK